MYGAVGVRLLDDSERPGQFVPDPGSLFADGGKNWGSFFVAGSVGGVTQFIARVQDNATFAASMASPPAGRWSFQLISYATAADALADTNRILIGHPWRETERPGDVRDYDVTAYVKASPLFTDVALRATGADAVIAGRLGAFVTDPSCRYRILVTNEVDVEYAWALQEATPGPFIIREPRPFGGKVRLRLVELEQGCGRRVIGQVWAEENAAVESAWPDLQDRISLHHRRHPVSAHQHRAGPQGRNLGGLFAPAGNRASRLGRREHQADLRRIHDAVRAAEILQRAGGGCRANAGRRLLRRLQRRLLSLRPGGRADRLPAARRARRGRGPGGRSARRPEPRRRFSIRQRPGRVVRARQRFHPHRRGGLGGLRVAAGRQARISRLVRRQDHRRCPEVPRLPVDLSKSARSAERWKGPLPRHRAGSRLCRSLVEHRAQYRRVVVLRPCRRPVR